MKKVKKSKKRPKEGQYYSLRQAVKYSSIKSREFFSIYVNQYLGADWSVGKIWVKKFINPKTGNTSYRYIISGEWLKEFNKRYNSGELRIFNISEKTKPIKYTLDDIRSYCRKRKIYTIEKFLEIKQHEENQQKEKGVISGKL
jgi:hypothetical protein